VQFPISNRADLLSNGCVILSPRLCRVALVPLLLVGLTVHAAAQVGVRPAEQWIPLLDSPERIESMRVPELIARLGVQKEMVIADVGAGSGVLTGPLALATGPRGTVYASDIDQALLTHIDQRALSSRLANVKTVLGTFTDPKLPAPVDLALMNDVLHHVEDRQGYLKTLASQMKRGGRLAIVDYTAEASPHKGNPALIVTELQVNEWAALAGLERTEAFSLYTDRFFVVYTKR
jgi:SAM-dependent methyltransferase